MPVPNDDIVPPALDDNDGKDIGPTIIPGSESAVDFTIPKYPRITNRFRAAVKKVLKELGLYEEPEAQIVDGFEDDESGK